MTDHTCLIVEDSPMKRQLLAYALARVKDLQVTEASDGADALLKLSRVRFDVVVTDIDMPVMDGLKLIHCLREDPANEKTQIVVLTTGGAEGNRERAMALGADAYVAKPVQAPHVVAKVKELLGIE